MSHQYAPKSMYIPVKLYQNSIVLLIDICHHYFCFEFKTDIIFFHIDYIILAHLSFTGIPSNKDYDDTVFIKTIPPSSTGHVLSQDIRINNDTFHEIEQRFALIGELGLEVPDEFACFRVTFGEAECRGRVGATGIRIRDNDR